MLHLSTESSIPFTFMLIGLAVALIASLVLIVGWVRQSKNQKDKERCRLTNRTHRTSR